MESIEDEKNENQFWGEEDVVRVLCILEQLDDLDIFARDYSASCRKLPEKFNHREQINISVIDSEV